MEGGQTWCRSRSADRERKPLSALRPIRAKRLRTLASQLFTACSAASRPVPLASSPEEVVCMIEQSLEAWRLSFRTLGRQEKHAMKSDACVALLSFGLLLTPAMTRTLGGPAPQSGAVALQAFSEGQGSPLVMLGGGTTGAAARGPNVVVFFMDDLGYGDPSSYGASDARTPNIDRLAREGVRLTDCYAAAPVCTPTRVAFMTGRYQQRVGLEWVITHNDLDKGLAASESALGHLLKNAGYGTGLIGKWHLGSKPEFHPNRHGFDEFFGFQRRPRLLQRSERGWKTRLVRERAARRAGRVPDR